MSAPTETGASATQRLDKWLWFVRVVKTRTLAAKLVANGGVRLNRQRMEKPSATVRPGDVLTIAVHDRVRILKVVAPGTRRGAPAEAQLLYEDLTPPRDPVAPSETSVAPREEGTGRPTKRERRQTDRLKDSTSWDET
jgi:ribosome-associated heat shock protein Hsp15